MKTTEFEIAVLGGGISGIAIALEASRRGKKVCLIEKEQCGKATSANSLRIIHGGLRYLQKFDFPRIVTSVQDQTYCLKNWSHLIKPLTCVAPLNGKGLKRTSLARVATLIYSSFLGALDSPLDRPYVDSRKSHEELPFLTGLASDGFLIWQDALLLDHNALVQSMISELKKNATEIFESTKAISLSDSSEGVEIVCQQNHSGAISFKATQVVNCMGAWTGELAGTHLPDQWCHAFNLVLKRQFSPNFAFGCDGEQGRYFFYVPRGQGTVLGTGYVEHRGIKGQVNVPESCIEQFILHAAKAAPEMQLSMDDVAAVESGILPMRGLKDGEPLLFGSGQLVKNKNVVHVLSTKYTTFRSQANAVLRLLNKS